MSLASFGPAPRPHQVSGFGRSSSGDAPELIDDLGHLLLLPLRPVQSLMMVAPINLGDAALRP